MGLVSTWLNGIGLNSVAPTFEAAGIITPSHLAELEVSYFESLGVTDPDDRRKLFYLVQRIKMAVNKKSPKRGDSVEERVDAVISESFCAQSPVSTPVFSTERTAFGEPAQDTTREEKKLETNSSNIVKTESDPRRSRRLAAKMHKENDPRQIDVVVETRSPSSVVAANASISSSRSSSIRSTAAPIPSPPNSPIKGHAITTNSAGEHYDKGPYNPRNREMGSAPSSLSNRKSQLQAETQETDELEMISHSATVATASLTTATESDVLIEESLPIRHQRNHRCWRPESRLPGSLRTGKGLSVIPSETAAPLSPLGVVSSSALNEEMENVERRREHSRRKKRTASSASNRRTTLSVDSDSLEDLLQSSVSESSEHSRGLTVSDVDSDDEGGSRRSLQRLTTGRAKSMSTSGSSLLQQQHCHQKRLSTSKSTHTSRSSLLDRKLSSSATCGSDNSTGQSRHFTTAMKSSARASAPIVQGMSESESWITKIGFLREDNDAEHELFRDEVDNQDHEYYDMRIKVIVRKRPLNKSEANRTGGGVDIIHPLDYGEFGRILVYQPKTRVDLTREVETIPFAYDNVFDESSTNLQIYERSLRNLIGPLFEGQWATCFAYGQTGSGKTYTMMGSNITGINAGTATKDEANLGLYYLAALDIFVMRQRPEYAHLKVHVSLFEIYGGKLFDLLNERKQIKCLEDSRGKVCFPGLTEHPVHTPEHVMELIEEGAQNRSTGTTSRNADSSRSHAVLQIKLAKNVGRTQNIEHARFNFIDLAGSERGADTSSSSRATRLEGAEINTSLLALKEVIRALATGGSMTHIPFRGSKLTQVLKESFVGDNTRCCMVACISPDMGNCEHTLNTLRYADRVKERNPESGVLPSSCQQPIKAAASLQPHRLFSRAEGDLPRPGWRDEADTHVSDAHDEESTTSNPSHHESPISALESALRTPPKAIASKRVKKTSKQKVGETLVANHRAVLSTWLSMVKNEMIMANQVDADRDGLDNYLAQLQELQSSQLGLISKLRESLHRYVSAAEGPQLATHDSDDDSFEDLRY